MPVEETETVEEPEPMVEEKEEPKVEKKKEVATYDDEDDEDLMNMEF